MGLGKISSFSQLTSNTQLQAALQAAYGSVDNIDLWVGLLAEDHLPGSSVGPLTRAIIADQFERLRAGDRFWYQRSLKSADLTMVNNTTLADVIRRNTTITNIQDNAFFYKTEVTGKVFADNNRDGVMQSVEAGIANRTLQLLDVDGNIAQTVQTDAQGRFKFDHIGTGTFTLHEVLPPGWVQTTPDQSISITKGMTLAVVVGTTNVPPPPPPSSPLLKRGPAPFKQSAPKPPPAPPSQLTQPPIGQL
jgi:hypothetical protein